MAAAFFIQGHQMSVLSGPATPVFESGLLYNNITTATTALVKSGAGTLGRLIINTAGAGSSAAIYDGLSASGTLIATVSTATQNSLSFGIAFAAGLCVVTSGGSAANITVAYA
jgi:hypothetical protein